MSMKDDKEKLIPLKWRVKSAVLSPDWLSVGIKVHVPTCGDGGEFVLFKCSLE